MTAAARVLRAGTIRARLIGVTSVLIVVIGAVMFLSARSTHIDHERALVDNVAGRQPVLVQRYLAEVLLVTNGYTADPTATGDTLRHTAAALLDGGAVSAVQGNDETIYLRRQTDPTVRAKLGAFSSLVDQLTQIGGRVATETRGSQAYSDDVNQLVVLSRVTANVGHDAVGRMTVLADAAVRANARAEMMLAGFGILVTVGLCVLLARNIVRRLRVLAEAARANADGDLSVRAEVNSADEIGTLASAFNAMADSLGTLLGRLEAEAARDGFGTQLVEALEMADDEASAYGAIALAMTQAAPGTPTELLVADSSDAHLQRVAVNPGIPAAGCPVESPFGCVAVRRGSATIFESSSALNACPQLRDRPSGPCSAVCVPVTFMGKALGVVHATGPDRQSARPEIVAQLTTLASQAGSRIGTVRAFQQSQLQASTDGLTGLMNRRTLENQLRGLLQRSTPFALAMVDLDHFKQLNDTFGHEGGDRALRLFSRTVREAVRGEDLVARYGGEEFVVVFVGSDTNHAVELVDRIRVVLSSAVEANGGAKFTASFGLTDTQAASTVDELFRRADEALMEAKREGRNRVVVAEAA